MPTAGNPLPRPSRRAAFRIAIGRLFPASSRAWQSPATIVWTLIECTALMGAAIAFSHWLSPDDPFGLRAQFPWLWLVPVLLALRYGTIDGLVAVLLLLAWWLLPWRLWAGGTPEAFPQQYFLGGLVLVLLAGQFADVWNTRLGRVRAANALLDERLGSLTRTHYMLRLSHQRLEQELLVRPVTLRDLLTELHPITPVDAGGLANAPDLLRLLAQSCEIESASVHRVEADRVVAEPAATIGDPGALAADDPLLAEALERGQLMHVRSADASMHSSAYLMCAPIVGAGRQRLGVLCVRSMPFVALNAENLQFVAVLLGYFADGLIRTQAIRPVLALQPQCPPDFALELVRCKRLFDEARVDSGLVAFAFERNESGNGLLDLVRRGKRATDLAWEIEAPNRHVLAMLLPLSGPPAVEGLLLRTEEAMRRQLGLDFGTGRVGVHLTRISEAEAEWTLDDLLGRAGVATRIPGSPAMQV